MIKYSDWLLSLNLFLSSCSPIIKTKHSTSETQEFISIRLSTRSKSNQALGKTRNYAGTQKSYSTSRTGIGDRQKKEVITNSERTPLSYFDKWKKKQQDQSGKYFYF